MSARKLDRRQSLGHIGAAALLPLAALGAPLSTLRAAPRLRAVPQGRFLLERVLARELSGDASLIVIRRWQIGFAAAAPGIVVSGEQTFADVAAPSPLSRLAALERARPTAGLFPIRLDLRGHIAGSAGRMDAAHLLRAIETAQAMLGKKAAPPALLEDARGFMARLAGLGAQAVSAIPSDLFFPATVHSSAARDVVVPTGDKGTITIDSRATVHVESGLLRDSERIIVTRLGASSRTSRESWSLQPAP